MMGRSLKGYSRIVRCIGSVRLPNGTYPTNWVGYYSVGDAIGLHNSYPSQVC
jgi:hypothetical protein